MEPVLFQPKESTMGFTRYWYHKSTITEKEWADITRFIKSVMYIQQNSMNVDVSMFKRDERGGFSFEGQAQKTQKIQRKTGLKKNQLFKAKYSKDSILIEPVFQEGGDDDGPRVESFELYRKPHSIETHKKMLSYRGYKNLTPAKIKELDEYFYFKPKRYPKKVLFGFTKTRRSGNSYQRIYDHMIYCILSYIKCRIPKKIDVWDDGE